MLPAWKRAILVAMGSARQNASLLLSYYELRTSIGVIGILLPFVVAIGRILLPGLQGPEILGSISAYYYSDMGNVFVGSLCAIGVFLWSYRGYDLQDSIAAHLAAVFGIGIALFPTAPESGAVTQMQGYISLAHATFAGGFFLTLAYFALVLFRKTGPGGMTRMKKVRNAVFLACGIVILISIAGIALMNYPLIAAPLTTLHPIFWLESLAIVAFGVSWFVKGESILKDD